VSESLGSTGRGCSIRRGRITKDRAVITLDTTLGADGDARGRRGRPAVLAREPFAEGNQKLRNEFHFGAQLTDRMAQTLL